MTPLENFYNQQSEPNKSCLLALRKIILAQSPDIEAMWKYGGPFFYYKGKMFCYLWIHKKLNQPYIGIVRGNKIDHPNLIIEKTSRMKKLFINANEDINLELIKEILSISMKLY